MLHTQALKIPREHIEQYVRDELEVSSSRSAKGERRLITDAIAEMPPEFQIFCLSKKLDTAFHGIQEYGRELIDNYQLTDNEQGKYVSAGFVDAVGLLNNEKEAKKPVTGRIIFNKVANCLGLVSKKTFHHEFAHRVDFLEKEASVDTESEAPLISCKPSFQQAANREFLEFKIPFINKRINLSEKNASILHNINMVAPMSACIIGCAMAGTGAVVPALGLVAMYAMRLQSKGKIVSTKEHMTQYAGSISHHKGAEAFAEVTKDYMTMYKRYNGDMDKVNAKLDKIYGNSGLWDEYKTSFLDEFQEKMLTQENREIALRQTIPSQIKPQQNNTANQPVLAGA